MNPAQQRIHDILNSNKYPIKWFDSTKVYKTDSKAAFVNGMPIGVVHRKFEKQNELFIAQTFFPCTQDLLSPNPICRTFDFASAQYYIGFHFVQFMDVMNGNQNSIITTNEQS